MKKKFIMSLVSGVVLVVLAACGGGTTDDADIPGDVGPTVTETTETTTEDDDDDEDEVDGNGIDPQDEGSIGFFDLLGTRDQVLARAASMPAPTGTLTFGSGTMGTANIMLGWDNVAINANVRDFVWGGLETLARNQNDEVFLNPVVVREYEVIDNPDGSRTHRFTIWDDLQFSDGTPIRAYHFAANAIHPHPYLLDLVTPRVDHELGVPEWSAGEIDVHPGWRFYDDYTFSRTISPDFLPFVWETRLHTNVSPVPIHAKLPSVTIHDDGYGVRFEGLTPEVVIGYINGGANDGWRFAPTVFAGPYQFVSFEESSATFVLTVNPYFPGTWDGYRPRIENIVILQRDTPVQIDSLALGELDLLAGLRGGDLINSGLDMIAASGGAFDFINYVRNGYGFIHFHVDHGPTQFVEVRQAITWLLDRDEFARLFTGGHGMVIQGPYSMAHWWYWEALGRGFYDMIIQYTYNPQMATELLENGGWVLNANGDPFVPGVDDVRYREMEDGSLMRLQIEWASPNSPHPVSDLISIMLPEPAAAIGMVINRTNFDSVLPLASRTGVNPDPEFHMFNFATNFNLWQPFAPWLTHDPDTHGQLNNHFSNYPELFEAATRLRFMELLTQEGRDEFVDAWMEFQIISNELMLQIPLYADIDYDMFNTRIQNWHGSSIWNWVDGAVRAYLVD